MLRDDLKELNITIKELSSAVGVPACALELLADGKILYTNLRFDDARAILDYLINAREKNKKTIGGVRNEF